MRIVKAAMAYFFIVFGAGFVLGLIRLPLLVPRLGVRTAELLEMPIMLVVIALAARRLARARPPLARRQRLLAGAIALLLLLAAELTVVLVFDDRSVREYIVSRDPVAGTVYLVSLVLFALAPALSPSRRGEDAPGR